MICVVKIRKMVENTVAFWSGVGNFLATNCREKSSKKKYKGDGK